MAENQIEYFRLEQSLSSIFYKLRSVIHERLTEEFLMSTERHVFSFKRPLQIGLIWDFHNNSALKI